MAIKNIYNKIICMYHLTSCTRNVRLEATAENKVDLFVVQDPTVW